MSFGSTSTSACQLQKNGTARWVIASCVRTSRFSMGLHAASKHLRRGASGHQFTSTSSLYKTRAVLVVKQAQKLTLNRCYCKRTIQGLYSAFGKPWTVTASANCVIQKAFNIRGCGMYERIPEYAAGYLFKNIFDQPFLHNFQNNDTQSLNVHLQQIFSLSMHRQRGKGAETRRNKF